MKMSVKVALSLAAMALIPALAHADTVTINMTAQTLYSSAGKVLPTGSMVVVLADMDGDGFGAITADTWSSDTGDVVLAKFASGADGLADQVLNFVISGTNSNTVLGTGDNLLLAWFNTPYSATATGSGAGVQYGTYRTDTAIDGDCGWAIPAGGANVSLLAIDVNQGGGVPLGQLVGTQQTAAAPEPASLAVLALGGTILALRRRRTYA